MAFALLPHMTEHHAGDREEDSRPEEHQRHQHAEDRPRHRQDAQQTRGPGRATLLVRGVLRAVGLRGSVLRGAVLRGAVLRGAVLRAPVLRGSVLRSAVRLRASVLLLALLALLRTIGLLRSGAVRRSPARLLAERRLTGPCRRPVLLTTRRLLGSVGGLLTGTGSSVLPRLLVLAVLPLRTGTVGRRPGRPLRRRSGPDRRGLLPRRDERVADRS
ncbi:pentapeptide repeat-containing protein [Frigoribacterium sp. CFBP9029]|uniref:pentapeptide repeat-containing protein n=1 Tax=Frigoribacterium sp. CFBP9029 TaxID=3096541 RepID=UPI0039C8B47F